MNRPARRSRESTLYDSAAIVDAPEHYEYARAMGLLTWGTWDTALRPFEERLRDFLQAYPPDAPARFQGTMLVRSSRGEYGPAESEDRLKRFVVNDNSCGSLRETLARWGLRLRAAPTYEPRPAETLPFRDVARLRNQRLRLLHGSVDIESENMDEAKAAELERLEKKRAAEQIREARERMRQELSEGSGSETE